MQLPPPPPPPVLPLPLPLVLPQVLAQVLPLALAQVLPLLVLLRRRRCGCGTDFPPAAPAKTALRWLLAWPSP